MVNVLGVEDDDLLKRAPSYVDGLTGEELVFVDYPGHYKRLIKLVLGPTDQALSALRKRKGRGRNRNKK